MEARGQATPLKDVGEIIEDAARAVIRDLRVLAGVQGINLALQAAAGACSLALLFFTGLFSIAVKNPQLKDLSAQSISRVAAAFSLSFLATIVLFVIVSVISRLALWVCVSNEGRKGAVQCYAEATSRLSYFFVVILSWLRYSLAALPLLGIGLALLPIFLSRLSTAAKVSSGILGILIAALAGVAIWFATWGYLAFSDLSFVVEHKSGLDALRRSRELVRGRFWAVLGRLLAIGLVAVSARAVASMPYNVLSQIVGEGGGNVAVAWLALLLAFFTWAVSMFLIVPFTFSATYGLYVSLAGHGAAEEPPAPEPIDYGSRTAI